MYKTEIELETKVKGLIHPRMKSIPAETISIDERIHDGMHTYKKVVTGLEADVTELSRPMRNKHGFIDVALPEGKVKIDMSATLSPAYEMTRTDKKDWDARKEKYFH
jgi:hypothetical protein